MSIDDPKYCAGHGYRKCQCGTFEVSSDTHPERTIRADCFEHAAEDYAKWLHEEGIHSAVSSNSLTVTAKSEEFGEYEMEVKGRLKPAFYAEGADQ